MSNLRLKRFDAIKTILATSAIEGTADVVPTPVAELELTKQLALAAGDIYMCIEIWRIYFEEEIAEQELINTLLDVGLATLASGVLTYSVTSLVKSAGQFAGFSPLSAILSISQSAVLGFLWIRHCEKLYRNAQTQVV